MVLIKVSGKTDEEMDSFSVAKNLKCDKRMNPILFLWKQSIDYDKSQVEHWLLILKLPSISVVVGLEIDGKNITAEREIEGGKEL